MNALPAILIRLALTLALAGLAGYAVAGLFWAVTDALAQVSAHIGVFH